MLWPLVDKKRLGTFYLDDRGEKLVASLVAPLVGSAPPDDRKAEVLAWLGENGPANVSKLRAAKLCGKAELDAALDGLRTDGKASSVTKGQQTIWSAT